MRADNEKPRTADPMMECRPMSRQDYERVWPQASTLASKTLFHELSWLDYLESIGKGRARFLALGVPGDPPAAYHVYLEVRLGPLRVMGSPLPGWTTNYMGPLLGHDVDQGTIVAAILRYARRHGFVYAEFKNKALDPAVMAATGCEQSADVTAVLRLTGNPNDAWRGCKSTARNRIRKAEASGLVCEATEDRGFVREYYDMIVHRYAAQGLSFPFQVDRLLALWDCLKPAGRLLALRVLHEGETIGGGLFPFDEGAIYYFGGASRADFNHLCPNELMHWTVIRFACSRGIAEYDLCGTSRFKRKFGAEDVPFVGYGYSPIPGMMRIRSLLHRLHWKRLQWLHAVRTRLGSTGPPPAATGEAD